MTFLGLKSALGQAPVVLALAALQGQCVSAAAPNAISKLATVGTDVANNTVQLPIVEMVPFFDIEKERKNGNFISQDLIKLLCGSRTSTLPSCTNRWRLVRIHRRDTFVCLAWRDFRFQRGPRGSAH